jgi:hypothetical protein
MGLLDDIIDDKLETLREEKYKLRVFQVNVDLEIESRYGVEESLQAIRAINGVTIVTAIDSKYSEQRKAYLSRVKIKFHPKRDTMTPIRYINTELLPALRNKSIPGVKFVKRGEPERVS